MKGQVTVLGRRGGQPQLLRRWIYFHVDFRFHPTDVIRIVTEAVTAAPIEGVAASPEPSCIVMEFTESLARYALRYWLTDLAADDPTDSNVRTRVFFALNRASIPMAMPALHVFATEESHQREVEKSAAELEQRRKALTGVDFFDRLPEADVAELARGLRPAPFASGEVMTRQGAEAHWLYIIVSGEARVSVAVAGGLEQEVRRVGPGSFFGEMSLMTGEPRQATVVALTDVTCYRLDREAFREILKRRPEQAEYVAGILARRRVELIAVREDLDHEAQRRRMTMEETHLLERIRHFFGLSAGHPPGTSSGA
jgi:CRP-like cAMP-binding protein